MIPSNLTLNRLIKTSLTLVLSLPPLFSCQHVIAQQFGAVESGGRRYTGTVLAHDGRQLALLLRDGQMQLLNVKRDEVEKLKSPVIPFSLTEIQSAFFKEYGQRYDVSKTENFVVVHPWGNPATWAEPFEDFHARFMSYFESKNYPLKQPSVPLIALVLRSRQDFDRSLINEVQRLDSRIAGYYSRTTNRITTYDPAGQLRDSSDRWIYSSWPIIHESTHQSAFNCGVHNRFAPPPTWLSEGLATMFEARGIHNHLRYKKASDRVNLRRLKQLRRFLDTPDFYNGLINLIANDKLFSTHLEMAYGISWGLAFYLAETQPDAFFKFIARDARRKNFAPYTSQQRLREFSRTFGNDYKKLAADLRRYYRVK